VAFDQRTLVVVEVKTRQADHQDSYTALSAVNPAKREILLKTTRAFRRAHGPLCRRYAIKHDRIDALEVYYRRTKFGCLKATELRWHRGVVRSPEHSLA
jgi:Holliday junction resolvase-like predicted endonuclease